MAAERSLRLAALALVVLALAAGRAESRTYTILTFADDAAVNGNCTLREALRAARDGAPRDQCPAGDPDGNTIVLPAGTYPFAGREVFTAPATLEIRSTSLDPATTVVDLQHTDAFLELTTTESGASLTLRGLTIENGNNSGDSGGALSLQGYGLALESMRFESNHAFASGGAVWCLSNRQMPVSVHRSIFSNNSARYAGGGLSVLATGMATVVDVVFDGNSVSRTAAPGAAFGGGLDAETTDSGNMTIERCTFVHNSVYTSGGANRDWAVGGGAELLPGVEGSTMRMKDCIFIGNSASVAADVGALQVAALDVEAAFGSATEIDRVLVDLSSSSFANGGYDVFLQDGGGTTISFTDAQITYGSWNGLGARTRPDSKFELGSLTVADYASGTAVYLDASIGGKIRLRNSLVALAAQDLETHGGDVLLSGNCVAMSGDFPGFVDSFAGDYRLASGSVAIDAGLPGQPTQRFADLDHAPRVVGGAPDCGAFERGGLFADGFEVGDVGDWDAAIGTAD
jgi:CSLREA domain-containing protein